ncbi:MAG: hypothetical protein D3909_15240, partial [Candidatus Electrothrix sp. ATG1]|nr:hypothetical protein [Candidatus Electrothrix sp. ATG1]
MLEGILIVLITAATDMEMQAVIEGLKALDAERHQENTCCCLVTGVGPVETTLSLAGFLYKNPEIDCVLNFGIAGAYRENKTSLQAGLLDLCLAK